MTTRRLCGRPTNLIVLSKMRDCHNIAYAACADCAFQACWRHLREPCPAGADTPFGGLQHITPAMQSVVREPDLLRPVNIVVTRFPGDDRPAAMTVILKVRDHPDNLPPVHAYPGSLTSAGPRQPAIPDQQLNRWLRQNGVPTPDQWEETRALVDAVRAQLTTVNKTTE